MSVLDIDRAINEMDEYAETMTQWNEAYEKFLDGNPMNRMFEFFAKHCPHEHVFVYMTDYRAWVHWTEIEQKLNKPFGAWRLKLGIYKTCETFKVKESWLDVIYTPTQIKYKDIWYSFPSAVHLRDAVIPEWLLFKKEWSNEVHIHNTFRNINFYLENCVVPEGILPKNIIIV